MADVSVKVKEEFRDRTEDLKLRKKDEVLTVSEERAEKLAGLGLVMFVENETEAPAETEEQPKKRGKQSK